MKRRTIYERFRKAGYTAANSYRAALIVEEFQNIETATEGDGELVGECRIGAKPEDDSYFAIFGEPEGYTDQHGRIVSPEQERAALCESFERDGVGDVFSEVWNGDEWQTADSIGMCAGYTDPTDPIENWYVPDLMQAVIEQAEELCTEADATRRQLGEFAGMLN